MGRMSRLLGALAVASVLITGAVRFQLAAQREFDPDEFQHLHTAWCIDQGLVPYRDFFEHHMPGLPLLLSAVLPLDSASRSAASALSMLETARLLMWVCSFATIGLTWLLARDAGGPEVAAIATALLTFSIIFTGKGLEVRPDGPATACWVLSLRCPVAWWTV